MISPHLWLAIWLKAIMVNVRRNVRCKPDTVPLLESLKLKGFVLYELVRTHGLTSVTFDYQQFNHKRINPCYIHNKQSVCT